MNHRIILRILSRVALTEAILLALTALVALLYGEAAAPFALPMAALLLLFLPLNAVKPQVRDFFAREGFVAVSLSWIFMSFFGALPFWISGVIPTLIESLFESVSGFTTTGATVLANLEALPQSILFWRALTHWVGGMGVLVFLLAVVPLVGGRSMLLMRAEATGPTASKLVPRTRSTSAILYSIYFGMTLVQVILLLCGGMPLFDSVITAFSTAGTGGFAGKSASIMAYESVYIEIVVTIFMLLFSVNFTLYFLVLVRRPLEALKNEELHWFLGIFVVSTLLMAIDILPLTQGFGEALRLSAFQAASVSSSTGFASTDFAAWPEFSHNILMILMIIGACAGSTGGGFKVARVIILAKAARREIDRMVHPRSVARIKFGGKILDDETIHSVLIYLAVYVMLLLAGILLISLNGFDLTTTLSSVLSALNNVGAGLSKIGPRGSFAIFSPFSKAVFCVLMLIGRLEIFPVLLLLVPSVWRRN